MLNRNKLILRDKFAKFRIEFIWKYRQIDKENVWRLRKDQRNRTDNLTQRQHCSERHKAVDIVTGSSISFHAHQQLGHMTRIYFTGLRGNCIQLSTIKMDP